MKVFHKKNYMCTNIRRKICTSLCPPHETPSNRLLMLIIRIFNDKHVLKNIF